MAQEVVVEEGAPSVTAAVSEENGALFIVGKALSDAPVDQAERNRRISSQRVVARLVGVARVDLGAD